LASAFGSVWAGVEGEDDGLLVRVDPATNRVTGRTGLGGVPKAIGAGDGSLWVFVLTGRRHRIAAKLLRVDAASGRVLVRRTLDTGRPNVSQVPGSESIHYGFGSLWITDGPRHRVYRFDPASGRVLASVKVGLCPQGLAFAGGRVWIADRQDGAVRELDPARNRVVGRAIAVSTYDQSVGRSLGDMLWLGTRDGRVWIYDPSRPGLVVLDPATRRIAATPSPAAGRAGGVAASGSTLWLADSGGIGRIGLADGRPIGSRLPLRTSSTGTSFAAGSFWVTDDFGARLVRIDPPQRALKRSA
jgi:streptogramin lyase